MRKANMTIIFFLTLASLFEAVASEVPKYIKIDYPEIQNDVNIESIEPNWQIAITSGVGALVSVYIDQIQVWKSQPIMEYFAMSPSLRKIDVDGNGEMDAVLTSFTPHAGCIDFGAIYSLNGGKENYLIHVNTGYGMHKDSLFVEASERLTESLVEFHIQDTIKRCGWSAELPKIQEFASILRDHQYHVLGTAQQAYPKLKALHAKAMNYYQKKDLSAAIEAFEEFFDRYDYRRVDPENQNSEYTRILNDYGFFLTENSLRSAAIPILIEVIKRDPGRMVAYLNLADAEYRYYDANDPRTFEIIPGVGINLPGGGTDISRNRKIKGHPDAPFHYRKYHDLMVAAGKKDKIPARVFDRMK